MNTWTLIWLAVLALAVIAEVAAVIVAPASGTLTERWYRLYQAPFVRAFIWPVVTIGIWHLLIEPYGWIRPNWLGFVGSIAVGVVIATVLLIVNPTLRYTYKNKV